MEEIRFLPPVAAVAIGVAALFVRRLQYTASEEPSWGEWLLGAWSLVFFASLTSLYGLLFYWIFDDGTRVLVKLASYLGWSIHPDAARIATIASAVFPALSPLLVGLSLESMLRKLYPEIAGTRSPFFRLLAEPRKIIGVAAALTIGRIERHALVPVDR